MRTHGFGGKGREFLMNRVSIQPALLRWARERSRRSAADLQKRSRDLRLGNKAAHCQR